MTAGFDLGRPYEKHPQVAIRHEEIGGLAYHFGSRRLLFLRAPELVALVETLGDHPTASEAIAACVPAPRRESAGKVLARLLASDVIRPRQAAPGGPQS